MKMITLVAKLPNGNTWEKEFTEPQAKRILAMPNGGGWAKKSEDGTTEGNTGKVKKSNSQKRNSEGGKA
jgi:hypothetical protein